MNTEHTPEPWTVNGSMIRSATGDNVASMCEYGAQSDLPHGAEANARRIVACVNACAGISTETLETAPPWKAYAADRTIARQRDELAAALDRAAVMLERVTRRGAFVVGCDAAAKEARAALAKLET